MAQHGKPTRLLPEMISKDPLAAAVRDDDPQWAAIVSWVKEALVQAEESGVTRANVTSNGRARCEGGLVTIRCCGFCWEDHTRSAASWGSRTIGLCGW